jgi:hypothetical protein
LDDEILLIPQIILGLSAFFSTWLNIYHRFIIPQLAPLFYNIGKLIGVAILVPLMGGSIGGWYGAASSELFTYSDSNTAFKTSEFQFQGALY